MSIGNSPGPVNGRSARLARTTAEGLADGHACREAALQYQALDWHTVIDCPPDHVGVGRAHAKHCDSLGKSPLPLWKWLQERPPTVQDIQDWWRTWPNGNVGTVL